MENLAGIAREYWAQITAACGGIAFIAKKFYSRWRRLSVWRSTIDNAIVAVLHGQIFAECQRILAREPVLITEDELENLEIMYASYTALGGNGTIRTLMERVRKYSKIVNAIPEGGETHD